MRRSLPLLLLLLLPAGPATAGWNFSQPSAQYAERSESILSATPHPLSIVAQFRNLDSDTSAAQVQDIFCYTNGTGEVDQLGLRLTESDNATASRVLAMSTDNAATVYANTSTQWTQGSWHHGAAVLAATNSRAAYLDGGGKGTDATSRSPTVTNTTSMSTILRFDARFTLYDGDIARVCVYGVALSDGQVASLASGWWPLFAAPSSVISFYPTDDGGSGQVTDLVGGYHLTTLNGSPTAVDHKPLGPSYPSPQF